MPEVLDRAHVVEAVGELDQDHAHVLRHRHDHLAVVLGLRLLAALELDPRQLRDALDELRDLVAELRAHLLDVDVGVLDDVVQQRGRDRLLVEAELGADLRRAPRVVDEVLARAALLALVRVAAKANARCEQVAVDVRVVGRDVRDAARRPAPDVAHQPRGRPYKECTPGPPGPDSRERGGGARTAKPADPCANAVRNARPRDSRACSSTLDDSARRERRWRPRRAHPVALSAGAGLRRRRLRRSDAGRAGWSCHGHRRRECVRVLDACGHLPRGSRCGRTPELNAPRLEVAWPMVRRQAALASAGSSRSARKRADSSRCRFVPALARAPSSAKIAAPRGSRVSGALRHSASSHSRRSR